MTYQPQPIDTSRVEIGADLSELIERLAENVHENWAEQRMWEGWRHGPERNERLKEHPCLVPYGDLPESEKAYDRITVTQTIKAMLSMGYRISKE